MRPFRRPTAMHATAAPRSPWRTPSSARSRAALGSVAAVLALFVSSVALAMPQDGRGEGAGARLAEGTLTTAGGRPERSPWTVSDPDAWLLHRPGRLDVLERAPGPDTYEPPHRSPRRIALADGATFGDFDLTVESAQTSHEYGHRDLCVIFGFVAPDRFHYVHFATTPDEHACNVFVVDGAPRRRLGELPAHGVDWGATERARGEEGGPSEAPWHTLRVTREGSLVRAFFDGALVVEARDSLGDVGLVGVGTFDDSGRFRRFEVTGTLGPRRESPFAPVASTVEAWRDGLVVTPPSWPQGAGPYGDSPFQVKYATGDIAPFVESDGTCPYRKTTFTKL